MLLFLRPRVPNQCLRLDPFSCRHHHVDPIRRFRAVSLKESQNFSNQLRRHFPRPILTIWYRDHKG